ncbi:hypothetical protein F5879DRAFT_197110 [Lentinula edodes]|nr:hypothetical protein F5879DRAFT_197110 [Lentinula edodes]
MIKPSLTWTSWEIVQISCGTILKLFYIAAVLKLFCYFRDALLLEVKCGLLVAWRRWCITSFAQVCSNAVVHIVQPKLYPVLHFLLLISVAFACCYCLILLCLISPLLRLYWQYQTSTSPIYVSSTRQDDFSFNRGWTTWICNFDVTERHQHQLA